MRRRNRIVFYATTIGGLIALILYVLAAGRKLEAPAVLRSSTTQPNISKALEQAFHQPVPTLLMQLTILLLVVRLVGVAFRKIGQPGVVGEIVAGIALGPSLLGWVWPAASEQLFPAASMPALGIISQLGLVLFMFVIGLDLDIAALRKSAGAAVIISHASIVIPFGLGVSLAYFLYHSFAAPGAGFAGFALFMGIAMSITAFPVLARIIKERGMGKTRIGMLALSCAAADDVTAWCVLAFVIASVKAGSALQAWYTLVFTAAYLLLMFGIVRPAIRYAMRYALRGRQLRQAALAGAFIVLLVSAFLSEMIGIHALFGAFVAGVAMPQDVRFREAVIQRIEDLTLVLLLPVFFVITGLRTSIGLLHTPQLWAICGLIIVVAVVGKFGGSALAARVTGESVRDSLAIGALMNTRGLMELVVLNIGYDLHILSRELFAMMVLMALATTIMTSPLLDVLHRKE